MRVFGCALLVALAGVAQAQITLGQEETFSTGLNNWTGSFDAGTVPQWISTDGADGPADGYMRVIADPAARQGSRLAAFELTNWIGNYQAAGVNTLSADFKSFSTETYFMRVVLFSGLDRWTSTVPFVLTPGQDWTTATFVLDSTTMTQVQGSSSWQTSITSVDRLMFRNDTDPPSAGGSRVGVHGEAGYDNIRALSQPVPEPATLAVLGIGVVASLRRRRRR